jgi:8-oxo-dGTP pyrophosphatase MutT (NUDIX family)
MNHEQRNIYVTLQCFVKKDGKYLMLHRGPHKKVMPNVWMAPGGKKEFNEGVFECARREIKEETNLDIKNLHILCTGNAFLKDLGEELFFHLVGADYAGGELPESPEDGKFEWLTLEEILKLNDLLAELKDVLPIILGDNPKVISYCAEYEAGNKMTEFNIEKE